MEVTGILAKLRKLVRNQFGTKELLPNQFFLWFIILGNKGCGQVEKFEKTPAIERYILIENITRIPYLNFLLFLFPFFLSSRYHYHTRFFFFFFYLIRRFLKNSNFFSLSSLALDSFFSLIRWFRGSKWRNTIRFTKA